MLKALILQTTMKVWETRFVKSSDLNKNMFCLLISCYCVFDSNSSVRSIQCATCDNRVHVVLWSVQHSHSTWKYTAGCSHICLSKRLLLWGAGNWYVAIQRFVNLDKLIRSQMGSVLLF